MKILNVNKKTTNIRSWLTALICCLGLCLSCQDNKESDAADEATIQMLHTLDDSLAHNSPFMEKLIEKALHSAKDSITWHDIQLRWMRHCVDHEHVDTCQPRWKNTVKFISRQKPSPRINGMLAYMKNTQAAYLHKFHVNPQQELRLYSEAYVHLSHSDRQQALPDLCANMGDAYISVNDMPHAAWWYRRALFLADSLKLPRKVNVSLYMGLGRIYVNLGDFESAQKCYETADKSIRLMSTEMQYYFLNNYGNYYYYKGDYKQALQMFKRLEQQLMRNAHGNSYAMHACHLNMADVYLNLYQTEEAYRYLADAEKYFKRIKDNTAVFYANTILIGLKLKENNVKEVRRILQSETENHDIDFTLQNIRSTYLRRYYVKTGNYLKAYENLCRSNAYNDSLKHNAECMRTADIIMRHTQDTLILHHQIAMQEKDAHLHKAQLGQFIAVLVVVILILLCLFAVTLMHKRRLQTDMQLMEIRLRNIRNRISPHFIFNMLNNSIVQTDEKSAKTLVNMANLIRTNLKMSGKYWVTLKEELDFVNCYISVITQQMDEPLDYRVDTPDDQWMEQLMIPSMFIQILVENAIKHGLKSRQGAKSLHVGVSIDHDSRTYCVAVTDNGIGFDIRKTSPHSTQTGMKVIQSTIHFLNRSRKRKISMNVRNITATDGNITGCQVSITIPIEQQPDH